MKKLKITDQGSANESHSDLPQHINQNGKNKKGLTTNIGKDMKQLELSYTVDGNVK